MSEIVINCPNCQFQLTVDSQLAGEKVLCLKCGSSFEVDIPAPEKVELSEPQVSAASAPKAVVPQAVPPASAPKAVVPASKVQTSSVVPESKVSTAPIVTADDLREEGFRLRLWYFIAVLLAAAFFFIVHHEIQRAKLRNLRYTVECSSSIRKINDRIKNLPKSQYYTIDHIWRHCKGSEIRFNCPDNGKAYKLYPEGKRQKVYCEKHGKF